MNLNVCQSSPQIDLRFNVALPSTVIERKFCGEIALYQNKTVVVTRDKPGKTATF
jgi:hypothetical protein